MNHLFHWLSLLDNIINIQGLIRLDWIRLVWISLDQIGPN